jgi:carbon-monoxide dehydrogenase large subunit
VTVANRYIGSPVERVEDLRFLRGRGEYVADLVRDGLLHAAVLRSSVAHGRIRRLDTAPALALPGVHAVVTAAEIGALPRIPLRLQTSPATEPFRQPVIAAGKVRYVGEPIAVVVANSMALAEDGVDAVELAIEPLPVVADRHASGRHETLLFEEAGSNLAMRFTATRGDVEAAFAAAEYTRQERFSVQRHTALPLEPRGLLAEWDAAAGRLTVSGAAKVPHFNRRTLAQMLGLPESAVDLIENDVGGGFGARGEFYPEDFLIPFTARHLGRPVMWIEDRREH